MEGEERCEGMVRLQGAGKLCNDLLAVWGFNVQGKWSS